MRIFCEICTDIFDESKPALTTVCGHIFHENCIKKWLRYAPSCPKCRKLIHESSMIRLFFSTISEEADLNDFLDREINSLKRLVQKQNLEIMRREMAEADARCCILETKMRAMKLEQQINEMQEKHLKAIKTTMKWCLSLKNALEKLAKAATIMKKCLEDSILRQRQLEVNVFKSMQEFEALRDILPAYNHCVRNIRRSNSVIGNKVQKLPTLNFLSAHILLCSRCRRNYNTYEYIKGRNLFVQKEKAGFKRLSNMQGASLLNDGICNNMNHESRKYPVSRI